jgi:hypothetical protein
MQAFMDHLVYSKTWGYRLTRHLLFWLLYFQLFKFMMWQGKGFTVYMEALPFLPITALFVYFVLYRLAPRYLMHFAYWSFFWRYCLALLACLTIEFYLGDAVVYPLFPPVPFHHAANFRQVVETILDPFPFSVVNVMAGTGVFIKIYKFWRAEVWLKLQIARDKARAELELLKAQLQPQFLKNTLTHLYGLMKAGSDKPPQLLMRLSAILSYILYECRETEVLLEREVAICKEYIALEAERNSGWLEVSVDISGSFAGKSIAPLILLQLIGNAFPCQADVRARGWMAFEFSMEADQLLLRVIDGTHKDAEMRSGRPGRAEDPGMPGYLDRLHLLYAGRATFSWKEREDDDIVSLTIELGRAVSEPLETAPRAAASLFRYAVFDY